MIKDVFVLNKNGWYVKLNKWMWDVDYTDFSHMCPFFWLTVASILFLIPYLLFRGLITGILWLQEKMKAKKEVKSIKETKERIELLGKLERDPILQKDLATKLQASWDDGICLPKHYNKLWYDLSFTEQDKIRTLIEAIRAEKAAFYEAKLQREAEQREKERLAAIARKARINTILKYAKPIGKIFLWLLAAATVVLVGYLLFKGALAIAAITAKQWIFTGKVLLMLLGVAAFIIGCAYASNKIKFELSCKTKKRLLMVIKPFIWIAKGFIWLIKGIAKICRAIFQTVKNECPAINWK